MANRDEPQASQNNSVTPSDDDEVEEVPAPSSASKPAEDDARKKARFEKKYKISEYTDKEILVKQMASWRSSVYDHFEPPEIIVVDGEIKYKFICKTSPSTKPLTRARWDDSTSNLVRHVNACNKSSKPPPGQKAIDDFAQGTTYNPAKFRVKLNIWIARRHRPYNIVQDPEFLELLRMLNAKVEVPHPTTISRDIREIFTITREAVGKMLQEHPGRLHLCLDGWTSPNVISFLGITVHRVHDGKAETFILDFVKLINSHTGVYLSQQLTTCLKAYGIEDKILGITADNASNNNTLVADLETSLSGINSRQTRVRCFAHILNLVVKAIISPFMKKKKKPSATSGDDDTDDDDLSEDDEDISSGQKKRKGSQSGGRTHKKAKTAKTCTQADDDDDLVDEDNELLNEDDLLRALEEEGLDIDEDNIDFTHETNDDDDNSEDELDADADEYDAEEIDALVAEIEAQYSLSAAEQRFARYTVTKLVELANCCIKERTHDLQMVRAIATRWNSLAQAIGRALKLRAPLTRLLSMPKYDKKGKKGLARFKLSKKEWDLLEQLHAVLTMFLRATDRVSRSNIPLVHEVIPVIDIITGKLLEAMTNDELPAQVRYGAALGYRLLNKYYSATDESIMYRCAMLLHPKYKVDYFRNQKWKADWITAAIEILRSEWEDHYKPKPDETAPTSASQSQNTHDDPFACLDTYTIDEDGDVLDDWLKTPTHPTCTDPLLHWENQRKVAPMWEPLARMALDFLSVPASSTDVERAFSRGGLTVSKRRHSLNDESTRAATVISSWAAVPGLIPEAALVATFADKAKRSKKKASDSDIELVE
ncbi:hAT transposon family protein [Phanerochaete sordida]|uniref:HAT transposon family protein n=1 Tax=Phanerochaete sordida TaxID=48140 RepID=A0A9P3FYN6_9APHY|nr:hAT transposon family protein [Phanerochaete sordida]